MADMTVTKAAGQVNHAIMQHYTGHGPNLGQMGAAALHLLQVAFPAAHVNAVVVDIKYIDPNNAYKGVAGVSFKITSGTAIDPTQAKNAL
jgi:hypothetical protein